MWKQVIDDLQEVHILVNNAAISNGKDADELTIQEVKKVMDTNFVSYVQATGLFLK